MRKHNLRLIAFLLILVFSQKLGVRLWLHEWLHAQAATIHCPDATHYDRLPLKCDCIDDLMMPMSGVHFIEFVPPGKEYIAFIAACPSPVFSPNRHIPSLRGPPPLA
jgi:hypothetical protein